MTTESKPKRERVIVPASQRVQAVLSVWTERRRPAEICRELNLTPGVLAEWQERAMRAMLVALQPRQRTENKPALTAKLERLLNRQAQTAEVKMLKLDKRLRQLQQEPVTTPSKEK